MAGPLEDELGDILEKARDGKSWSQEDLSQASGVAEKDIQAMENYELVPDETTVLKLAEVLDLDGPSLMAISRDAYCPQAVAGDPDFELVTLEVLLGSYPVKCYLLRCKQSGESCAIDTGANPKALIQKAKETGMTPSKILLTHTHYDHAGGLDALVKEWKCPTWVDKNEPRPKGYGKLNLIGEGDVIELGALRIHCISTPGHTPGGVSYKVNQTVFSGDIIFAGSMGRANSTWSGLFAGITQKILTLPDATILHPGHGPSTTVGEEKQNNPFFCGKV